MKARCRVRDRNFGLHYLISPYHKLKNTKFNVDSKFTISIILPLKKSQRLSIKLSTTRVSFSTNHPLHRLASSQKWRGAHHPVLAGDCGHPHQLRQEDLWPVHQSVGLPPPPPAAGGYGGLQPGAVRPARVPGANPGRLPGHPQVRRPHR